MSRRIKPKEKYVRISMKEVWCNLDSPLKNKEFVELLSRPKVAQSYGLLESSYIYVLIRCVFIHMVSWNHLKFVY